MSKKLAHSFHIPVMGLGFTIDTPVKVAHLGISSVISIMDDHLVEEMREVHSKANGRAFTPILKTENDYRAKRIQAYLNLVNELVNEKIEAMHQQSWEEGSDLYRYFDLLPESSPLKQAYLSWLLTKEESLENYLRESIIPGSIDVNIMSKVNKTNYNQEGEALEKEYADALSALRGYAMSNLKSSVIFSAGYNPLLYSYIEQFDDFFPNQQGELKKQIILKVSDFRSALTQGKLLAKKGLWISEFRIESGLNCGGHAFATDGLLLGPILEEFKRSREEMKQELFEMCQKVMTEKGGINYAELPEMRITVQGGIGTSEENEFLLDHYQTQGTGWGSPFLLVPEATNVDEATLTALATAEESDYYMSHASPLGVPFNNFRKSSSEKQRLERIEKGRPGSPCNLEYLSTNTEFTEKPICTASRQYQHAKIKELEAQNLPKNEFQKLFDKITEKACLCTGLGTSVLKNHGIKPKHHLHSIAICPGPNLAYFSGIYSLKEMVDHIYGRINILNTQNRPNLFVKELGLYVDYLKNEVAESMENMNVKQERYLKTFKQNLLAGVEYYKALPFPNWNDMLPDLKQMESRIEALIIPSLERNMA
ncbi:hypothetical protein [Aquirufa ecclesiirivi]|uniref:hypothetical protein n=1 Tax=Aquirufa ecclesiirivi TaxID=2715124 RepID=UPI0023D876EC|nr:hypothetical protein [Aquirufa ecclesiirivi]MDF0692522.1 hypothetical protein [Aquirufa ecclesiirivi]